VPGHSAFLFMLLPVSLSLPLPGGMLAYLGPPGPEFITYFWALLLFVGAAVMAILQWPISALRRYFSRARRGRGGAPPDEPIAADMPEAPGEGSHGQP